MGSLDRAKEAWEIHQSLTRDEKFELRPFMINIQDMQEQISEAEDDMGTKAECKKCRGSCCCAAIGGLIEKINYLYIFSTVSRWEREEIWTALEKDNTDSVICRFQGKKGCIIPRDSRPHVCRTFYCDRNRDMQKTVKTFRPLLYGQFKMLENELKGRGYEF